MAKFQDPNTGEIFDDQTGQITQPDDGFSFRSMARNVPGSALQLGKDIAQPIMHPIDTGNALASIIRGGISKVAGFDDPDEASIEAVGDFYKQRFGSVDKTLQTIESDPMGFLTDLSGVLGVAGKAGKLPRITAASKAIDPVNRAVGGMAKLVPSPEGVFQSAAKFTTNKKTPQSKVNQRVRTALDERIKPTDKGLLKLDTIVSDLGTEVDTLIDTATAEGKTINASRLAKELKGLRKKLGGVKIEGASDLKIVDNMAATSFEDLKKQGKSTLTPREVQDFKQDLFKRIDFDRSNQRAVPAVEDARKAFARGARTEIQDAVPGVEDLNRRQGGLLDLRKSLEPAAGRVERRDLVGLGLPMKATAGAVVGDATGLGLGAALGLLDTPKLKAAASMGLERLSQFDVPGRIASQTTLRQGLLELSQLSREERERWLKEHPSVFNKFLQPANQ